LDLRKCRLLIKMVMLLIEMVHASHKNGALCVGIST
jgi:hypothetical protein